MRSLVILGLAIMLGSCGCRYVDANNIEIDGEELELKDSEGNKASLEVSSLEVVTYLPRVTEVKLILSHEGRSKDLTIKSRLVNKRGCCGPFYEVEEVESNNTKLLIDPDSPYDDVYLIQL